MDSTMRAKTSSGIESITSTMRDSTWSTTLPPTAAQMPMVVPSVKERIVVIRATPMVVLAPNITRDSRSRPILSVPSQNCQEGGSQVSETESDSP